jgi:hypothetical protein
MKAEALESGSMRQAYRSECAPNNPGKGVIIAYSFRRSLFFWRESEGVVGIQRTGNNKARRFLFFLSFIGLIQIETYAFTSPFGKGGLRGIYFRKSPLTPLFQRGGLNVYIGTSSSILPGKKP